MTRGWVLKLPLRLRRARSHDPSQQRAVKKELNERWSVEECVVTASTWATGQPWLLELSWDPPKLLFAGRTGEDTSELVTLTHPGDPPRVIDCL